MYFKKLILQGLLFMILLAIGGHANRKNPDNIPMNLKSVGADKETLKKLWDSHITPADHDYCRCHFEGCGCCIKYRTHKICLYMNSPPSGIQALVATTYINNERAFIMDFKGPEMTQLSFDASHYIEGADITYRLYHYIYAKVDEFTLSVKILIRIDGEKDFVCNIGTFTLNFDHACNVFFIEAHDASYNVTKRPEYPPFKTSTTSKIREKPPNRPIFPPVFPPHPAPVPPPVLLPGVQSCGINIIDQTMLTGRIFGGVDVKQGEIPWQADLVIPDRYYNKGLRPKCGGSIISNEWIIMAATCYFGKRVAHNIRVGRTDLTKAESHEKIIPVSKFIRHPKFKNRLISFKKFNIALVKLTEALVFNDYVRPICLPSPNQIFQGMTCVETGWGDTGFDDDKGATHLKKVNTEIVDDRICFSVHYRFTQDNLCGAHEHSKGCQKHRGGPLQCKQNGMYFLAGIFTYHKKCLILSERPDVYTKITSYYDWLVQTIKTQ